MLSELVISVDGAVKSEVRIKEICCWSDSQIAIWWKKQCGKVWDDCINNRVENIREMVPPSRWFFVPTGLNPADVGTRPVSWENIDLDFWLKGPQFLLSDCKDWPSQTFLLSEKEAKLEERVVKTSIFSVVVKSKGIGEVFDCLKFSSLDKLLRITSYLVRFIFNLRTKQKNSNDYRSGDLSTEEIEVSKEHWLKYGQLFIANSDKYEKVKNPLRLYYDEKGILRLNTRVSNVESFNYVKKFPILLRSNSHFTRLVIRKIDEQHYHCGINSTLAFMQYNYWIVRRRQTVEKFLKNYGICKIVQWKTAISPETPKLPEFRVLCNHPFANIGVDYAGPLYFKESADNCVQISKCYVLLFTCTATRAVYLELTPNVGVHSLILAVRRFISRNGTPKLIISDNFKSFKSKDIKRLILIGNLF